MQHTTILVVDHNTEDMQTTRTALQEAGYAVLTAADGETAEKIFLENNVDMVIQEFVLTDMTGGQLCQWIRNESDLPIVILTAQNKLRCMRDALEWGADEYLVKPVEMGVFLVKIAFVLNRSRYREQDTEEPITDTLGILSIDLKRRIVEKEGKEVRLTPTEYKLLTVMAQSPNRIFTREQLITYALEDEFRGYDRSIDTYIKGLRKKIETDRKSPKYIRTVHGFGYKFVP